MMGNSGLFKGTTGAKAITSISKREELAKILLKVDEQINCINIRYVGTEQLNDLEYEETIRSLKKIKNNILNELITD